MKTNRVWELRYKQSDNYRDEDYIVGVQLYYTRQGAQEQLQWLRDYCSFSNYYDFSISPIDIPPGHVAYIWCHVVDKTEDTATVVADGVQTCPFEEWNLLKAKHGNAYPWPDDYVVKLTPAW